VVFWRFRRAFGDVGVDAAGPVLCCPGALVRCGLDADGLDVDELDVDGEDVPEPPLPRCFPFTVPTDGVARLPPVLLGAAVLGLVVARRRAAPGPA
jgi:hypothetical protein